MIVHSDMNIPVLLMVANLITAAAPAARANVSVASHGMVASVSPLATDAGVRVLRNGGNAIDAAVATALTLGVVDGYNSGLGGGCFLLAHLADGRLIALDGRETAPMQATPTMFIRNGQGDSNLSQTGALASGVPGSLAVYQFAVAHCGKRRLGELLLPAADLADKGFTIDERFAKHIASEAREIALFPATRKVLFKAGAAPYQAGDVLKQPDLARTYRAIADQGPDWFYKGPFAEAVGAWMKDNGGILTAADFARYEIRQREPIRTRYRGYTVVGFPPPSSGGVHVAQILGMLEQFDLQALERKDPASRVHVMAEAMKLAFADRAYWLGDPDFVKVPKGLVDPAYWADRAKTISLTSVMKGVAHGEPQPSRGYFGKHTTHIAAADEAGNWVAITTTVNTTFGSKVIVPGTGVVLNNQMDDFSIQPGKPNAFNLVGAEANAPAGGKRPLSSMSPTIIMKDNHPVLTLGAAGGPTIISQVVLVATNVLDLHDDLGAAIGRVRFHHQWSPDCLEIENAAPKDLTASLATLGHKMETTPQIGPTQAILRLPDGRFAGASDPRVNGKAAGW
jgi:gamma-glutamyltranspeptidase / glutathione hydrolase